MISFLYKENNRIRILEVNNSIDEFAGRDIVAVDLGGVIVQLKFLLEFGRLLSILCHRWYFVPALCVRGRSILSR